MTKRISILGSTGSIGQSALEVVRANPGHFEVAALASRANIDLLVRQITEFRPETVAVHDRQAARQLEQQIPGLEVLAGPEGLDELASAAVDIALCAVVGAAGLTPMLRAIQAADRVAVANKEPLVMAGELIMERVRARNVELIPVDSEHNAIFQCLQGHDVRDVRQLHITASGGPFYGYSAEQLAAVTPAEATRHPTWNMGPKISVDSATLMNKGLEVIEAMWLFGVPLERINVVIHPQSIVHSLVEYCDGSFLAQLSVTDMKFPIQFALTWPERVESSLERLDLTRTGGLTFAQPDTGLFPCLRYAHEAAEQGGTAPTALNAANEIAVAAFCGGRLSFPGIGAVVSEVLAGHEAQSTPDLETILAVDAQARRMAHELVEERGA